MVYGSASHSPPTTQHPLQAVLDSQERSGAWLARKTGKSTAYVTKVLNGTRRPSPDFRARAAEALGVPEALLFPAQRAA